jgi:hypothetical protein
MRHLVELADAANEIVAVGIGDFQAPLVEMWVAGELLDGADELDVGELILLFDIPPDELPWLSLHPTASWIAERMRLGKRPIRWVDRPSAWPSWNCRNARVARIWTARDGLDEAAIEALQAGRALDVVAPDPDAFVAQCQVELDVAMAHLRSVVARYWDHDWRRDHRYDSAPEDHLWRAAQAVIDLDAAIAARTG